MTANWSQRLEALGYALIDRCATDRSCTVPFHPDRFVDTYHGFYCRRS